MKTTTQSKTVLSEADGSKDCVFNVYGREAMTMHAYKEKVLLAVEPCPEENAIDTRDMLKTFGPTGKFFLARRYSLSNKKYKKCHLHYVSDLDLYFSIAEFSA